MFALSPPHPASPNSSATVEASPLTQQYRPDVFEPKIVQLYIQAFNIEDDFPLSEGFWRELFLLHPDKKRLLEILDPFTADDLLQIQSQTRAFFRRAVVEAGSGVSPRNENALENLTAFMSAVLSKRYTNPSADVIEVLAGLDAVDKLMTDLANGLDVIIKNENRPPFRGKAIKTALTLVSGGYQTTLGSYFTHRDLFPGLMKFTQENGETDFVGFVLLGMLVNLNKFEMHNPYQNRLEDYVHQETIVRMVSHVATVYGTIRDSYVTIQDDTPETWTESTLGLVGLKGWTSHSKPAVPEDMAKDLLGVLPPGTAAVSLPTYSFTLANKVFAMALVTLNPNNGIEAPFASFLSASSYMAHNAYRSQRALNYTLLNLLILQILVEDPIIVKRICSTELQLTVRLCRQRLPALPPSNGPRIPAMVILDICIDTLSHNLRRRLDVPLYTLALGILLRLISHLARTKSRITYHWVSLWTSLISVLRFFTQYADNLKNLPNIREGVCLHLASLLAFCLSRADNFLPDPKSYDDLFYKLVEAGPLLQKFKAAFGDAGSISNSSFSRATKALTTVSAHYHDLLQSRGKRHQSPAAVQQVIKEGHDTLDMGLNDSDDFGQWEPWREATWKPELKKIIKTVVEDASKLSER